MDKDQIKAIIKDLRSKGLSFQKISDILRELHSVDLNRETVRKYFQDIQKANNNTIQDNAESIVRETASTIETHNATGGESSSVQIPVEKNQEQNIKNVQPVRKVRYPGYEDEDLRKDPHYGSISRDYLEMTPRQRYEQHLERVKQDRKERNKSIALFALLVLMLVGIAFALKYRII